jgi:hypothetical protein
MPRNDASPAGKAAKSSFDMTINLRHKSITALLTASWGTGESNPMRNCAPRNRLVMD